MELRIGTSGWQYKHWRQRYYPESLATQKWLEFYAQDFDSVEINNSFYRLPPAATFAKWREQAPRRFLYAVKASRFLTHMKKLKDPYGPLVRFFANARELATHLGPVLYQLPPNWPINIERLETFLRTLYQVEHDLGLGRQRHVIEFRDPSWYDDRVFERLDQHKVALCLHDMQGSATGRMAVGPFVYVRFHFGDRKYGGAYDEERLDAWSRWLSAQAAAGRDVFAYFNNDTGGHAPKDAIRLRARVQRRVAA